MRKWLSFLGAITLLGTSTTSLVACNNTPQYNEEELQQLKQENQICTNCKEIKENLEWIAPQEKPFNTVDNKWYYVVWRGNENEEWRIVKFKNDKFPKQKIHYKGKEKITINYGNFSGFQRLKDLYFISRDSLTIKYWSEDSGKYFKAVYRWNGGAEKLPYLVVDSCGDVKVNSE
ncbi:lipoprotein [Spiroplasma citri]|uniref:Lipoprotein n=1 Tax=Spiroplasma citri TaxID=2133 RepID=A0AAX3SWZ8_SPICI|nr:lipoprotein [Spiroplasma citri]WFG95652.1 lipoprotein [Spiroplasma citri]